MALRQMDNAAYLASDWQDETESKNELKAGQYKVKWDNSTGDIIMKAGSSVEISGILFKADSDQNLGTISDGSYITYDGSSFVSYTTDIFTDSYNQLKNGYYKSGTNERIIGYYYDSTINIIDKKIGTQDLTSSKEFLYNNVKSTQYTLESPNAAVAGYLGYSVSITDNYLAVSAVGEAGAATAGSGRVYVYQRNPGNIPSKTLTLESPNAEVSGSFGRFVSITDNYLAVGAFNEDAQSTGGSGRVYVYERTTGNTWTNVTTLESPNVELNGNFGRSVTITDNYLAVGANQEDGDSTTGSGRVYVYQRTTGNTWTNVTTLESPNAEVSGYFGYSVSITDSYLAVGAYQEDADALSSSGRTYVYQRTTGNTWTNVTTLESSNTEISGFFGWSVSITDSHLIVGAYKENGESISDSGRTYIYERTTGNTWTNVTTLESPESKSSGNFGYSVSITGNHLTVGAYNEDGTIISDSGRVYVYERTTGNTWTNVTTLESPEAESDGSFGWSVFITDNYLAVGAIDEDAETLSASGRAYSYSLPYIG